MMSKKNFKIHGEEDIISKSSKNYRSVEMRCLKVLDFYRFLDANSDKLSKILNSISSVDANGMEDEISKNKFAYRYDKGQAIESFCERPKLSREDYLTTSRQAEPDFHEMISAQAIVVKNKNNCFKRNNNVVSKKRCFIVNRFFQKRIDKYKEAYVANPNNSYSTPSFTWKASLKYTTLKVICLTDDELRLSVENNLCGGPSSCMINRHVYQGGKK